MIYNKINKGGKDMDIEIKEGKYNKTVATKDKDGVEYHSVDMSKEYKYYEVSLFKRYYDVEDDEAGLLKNLKQDLEQVSHGIEMRLEKLESERGGEEKSRGEGEKSREEGEEGDERDDR